MPNRTTTPERIPIKLNTTCITVNVDVDMPRIMTRLLSKTRRRGGVLANMATHGDSSDQAL